MASLVNKEHFILRPADDLLQHHPALKKLSEQLAKVYASKTKLITEEELKTIGLTLWQALDADDDFTAYQQQQNGNNITPIVIASSDPAIQQLPWETLYHPQHGFLAKHKGYTVSRCLQP